MGDAQALLGKLRPGEEVAAGSVRGLAAVIPELVAAGLIVVRKDGRKLLVSLTQAGTVVRSSAPPAKVAKPKVVKPDLGAVLARLEALEARVSRLEAPTPADLGTVKRAVLDAVAELDARGRLGGLVPIPDVRAALCSVADDASVTAALEELEQEWKIDLNVAQSPTSVTHRDAGIERPGRGLLYYVSRRSP